MDKKAKIFYFSLPDEMRKEEKLDWFQTTPFQDIPFERILPDEKGNWINLTDNDFDSLVPVCSKENKKSQMSNTIFDFYSFGISTNRDEWVYDFNKDNLEAKMRFFIESYNELLEKNDTTWNESIKWSETLKNNFKARKKANFDVNKSIKSSYRPFVKQFYYAEKLLTDRLTQNHYDIFGNELSASTPFISFMTGAAKPFSVLANSQICDLNYLSPAAGGTFCLPLYRYDSAGNRVENITDWALGLFRETYKVSENRIGLKEAHLAHPIEKTDIFHYVYAVLHTPAYRSKYEQNLRRDFPRIPLYDDFWKWATAGKALMDLHLHYETAQPYPLKRTDESIAIGRQKNQSSKDAMRALQQLNAMLNGENSKEDMLKNQKPKPKLKADKINNTIQIDEQTTLSGIPAEAWAYKLGNRSALEWILDQYKESTPSDATIAEKFNTYRFADYKEQVIDLLKRVCTVSVETMNIVEGL